jgi:hypothetical protein
LKILFLFEFNLKTSYGTQEGMVMDKRRNRFAIASLYWVTVSLLSLLVLTPETCVAGTKIAGTGKQVALASELTMYPGDTPGHQITLSNFQSIDNSDDPDFTNVKVDVFGSGDDIAGNGSHNGYRVATHANGDHTFMAYEGTTKTVMKEENVPLTTFTGKWWFTGGTGKFEGITGGGTYTGKMTKTGRVYEWDGEYEIK